jgi:hypothetical protein
VRAHGDDPCARQHCLREADGGLEDSLVSSRLIAHSRTFQSRCIHFAHAMHFLLFSSFSYCLFAALMFATNSSLSFWRLARSSSSMYESRGPTVPPTQNQLWPTPQRRRASSARLDEERREGEHTRTIHMSMQHASGRTKDGSGGRRRRSSTPFACDRTESSLHDPHSSLRFPASTRVSVVVCACARH